MSHFPKIAVVTLLAFGSALAADPAHGQTIVNGDFRNSAGERIEGFKVQVTPAACAVLGSAPISGSRERGRALVFPAVPEPDRPAPGRIECTAGVGQRVDALVPGNVYQISFQARSGFPVMQGNHLELRLGTLTLFDGTVTSDTWHTYVLPGYLAGATGAELVIEGRGGDSPLLVSQLRIRDMGPVTEVARNTSP
jgi:hypothetical protein